MTNPYATDEPAPDLWFEQTNLAAVFIGCVAYGVHIVVYFACVYYLILEKKKNNWKWLAFVTMLFVLASINICINMHFSELAWIDDRNYPGGPLAFLMQQQALPINTLGNSATLVSTFLADGSLLYRVHVIWRRWYIVVIPTLMWLASTILSILTTVQAAQPASSLWASATLNFSIAYWSMSMSLNILLTILLITRLFWMRRKIINTPLGKKYGKTYTGIATMLLESALPYGLVSLVFIILYGLGNTAENLFIPLASQIACIAPELVILRVSLGRAWSNETVTEANLSALRFRDETGRSTTAGGTDLTNDLSMMTFKGGSYPNLRTKASDMTVNRLA
ncbi:hypothetical protein SCP_1502810 [Sparassis crispa]|uniref:Uncharacterized protein n=1 Tax=Sparassis crispa TaxID=139825 RepID=A0A401H4E2_9APHY|nr:hypothetical protein SCP_1502810 [Sparassis crispa]GBE89273.1 hypothetical protein SCP_1502810 [Sparassis crispa]